MKTILPLIACFLIGASQTLLAQLPGSGNTYGFQYNNASVPNNAALNSANALTIEAWIKADSWDTNIWENVIVSKDGWATGEQGYTLRAGAGGSLSFNIGIQGLWVEVTTPPTMGIGQWYHVAGTFDGTTLKAYINGIELGSTAYTGTIAASTYAVTIGQASYTVGGTRDFIGNIDEVRLWSAAVSQADLRDWMCRKATASHPNNATLMAYYNMDETTGTTLIDQGPNNLNGTVNGPTRELSGAAIGDASVHTYAAPSTVSLGWNNTDSVRVNLTGNAEMLHLFVVDAKANNTTVPVGYDAMDTTHYYGVYAPATGGLAYDATYYYGSNPLITGPTEARADLLGRADNADPIWLGASASLDVAADTLGKVWLQKQEFVLSLASCPSAILDQTGTQLLCGGSTLTVNETAGGWTGYQWLVNGNTIGGANSGTHVISTAGAYSLIVTDGTCIDTSLVIQVNVGNIPNVVFGSTNVPYCENGPDVTITGSTPAGGTYSGIGMTGADFSPSTTGPGTFTLWYTAADTSGCTNVDSATVTVFAAPVVTLNGLTAACENDAAYALADGSPANGSYTGAGVNGGQFEPGTAGAGTHLITYVYVDGNGCSGSDTASIFVSANPPAPTISQIGATLCIPSTINSVVWVDAAGNAISGATDTCFTTNADGLYGVTVMNANGCFSDVTWFDMTYFAIGEPSWATEVVIAPNPMQDLLSIVVSDPNLKLELQLFDAQGRLVEAKSLHGVRAEFNTTALGHGVYLLVVTGDAGKMTRRVVK
jgi:hypothetical protein